MPWLRETEPPKETKPTKFERSVPPPPAVVNAHHPTNFPLGNRINDYSRKGAKDAKFGENRKMFFFASLASWHENLC